MPNDVLPVSSVEARDLLQSGVDPSAVETLVRDRATLAAQQEEQKNREFIEQNYAPVTEEAAKQESEFSQYAPVDVTEVWDAPTLAKDKNFSLEAYVTAHPEVLQDNAKVAKLSEVWREKLKEPITAKDVGAGVLKLPWTTLKQLYKFTRGTGQVLYDTVSTPLASAVGEVTGQGPGFQAELQNQSDKRLAEDLAGLEQGTFNFASWLARAKDTLPRRFGVSSWDDLTPEQLQSEFRANMERTVQGSRIGKGEGEFSQAVGGETLKEVKERGEHLDEERVAKVAEADPVGFFLFGQAFGAAAAPLRAAGRAVKGAAPVVKAQELAAIRSSLNEAKAALPIGDPGRALVEDMLEAASKTGGTGTRLLSRMLEVGEASNNLLNAQLRARVAADAATRFRTAPAQAAADAAQAALKASEQAASETLGANLFAKIKGAANSITGQVAGQQAVGGALQVAGGALRGAARAVEAVPAVTGAVTGATLAAQGNFLAGLGAFLGAKPLLGRAAGAAGRALRGAGEAVGNVGANVRAATPQTGFQKALQGLAQGSGEVVAEGLKGTPLDVGFALALAETPEEVQNMAAYGAAFRALHAAGQPLARFVQAVKTGAQAPQTSFIPPTRSPIRSAEEADRNARQALSPDQQKWVQATEQFLRDAGSQAPVYVLPDANAMYFQFREQFVRKNGREPLPIEEEHLQEISRIRGAHQADVIGDDGSVGGAIFVLDPTAAPHEAKHAFQEVLGENGNRFVDQIIFDEFRDNWEAIGRDYTERLAGIPPSGNWRQALRPFISQEIMRQAGGDLTLAANITIAREVAAEQFATLFSATGGRPQAPTSLTEKLANVVDRAAKFFGVNLLQGVQTPGLQLPVSSRVQEEIRGRVQEAAGQARQPGAAPEPAPLPPTPTGQPTGGPPPAPPAPAGAAPRPQTANLREPPITPAIAEDFQAKTPERLNINAAQEWAAQQKDPEISRTVQTIGDALQRNPGEPVVFSVENLSVVPSKQEAAYTRTVRRAEQAVPEAIRDFYRKRIAVTRFLRDQFSGSNLQVAAMSLDKVLTNVFTLQENLAAKKATDLTPYEVDPATGQLTEQGWKSLTADLISYTTNQANGYRGDGREIVRTQEMQQLGVAIPEANPSYRPTVLPERTAQYLNVIQGVNIPLTAREFKGVVPGNVKGQVTREAQGEQPIVPSDIAPRRAQKQAFKSFPGREVREVNPLRDEMTRRGVNTRELLETTERLNIDRIRNATPEFNVRWNLPVTDIIRAGFLPEARQFLPGRAVRDQEGRRVESAAFRLPNGEIITGPTHFMALLDAVNAGKIPRELIEDSSNGELGRLRREFLNDDGFVDNQGNFLTRQEAFDLSKSAGQLSEEASQRTAFSRGELESTAFAEERAFLPEKIKPIRSLKDEDTPVSRLTANTSKAYWLSPEGKFYDADVTAPTSSRSESAAFHRESHASWAAEFFGTEGTDVRPLQDAGWVRVRSEPNQAIHADFTRPMGRPQREALEDFAFKVELPVVGPANKTVIGSTEVFRDTRQFLPKGKEEPVEIAPRTLAGQALAKKGFKIETEDQRGSSVGFGDFLEVRVKKGKDLVGRLSIIRDDIPGRGKVATVSMIEVDSKFQRQGIGEALMREGATVLQQEGVRELIGTIVDEGPVQIRERVFGPGASQFTRGGWNFSAKEAKLYMERGGAISATSKIEPDRQFLPEEKRREGPAKVTAAAIKFPNGEIYTGVAHFDALDKAASDGALERNFGDISYETALDALDGVIKSGFVDSSGAYLTREQAFERAKEIRQIPKASERDFIPAAGGGKRQLESEKFDEVRQFLPSEKDKELRAVPLPRLREGPASKAPPEKATGKLPERPQEFLQEALTPEEFAAFSKRFSEVNPGVKGLEFQALPLSAEELKAALEEVPRLHKENGGATYQVRSKAALSPGDPVYVVSPFTERSRKLQGPDLSSKELHDFMETNSDLLELPMHGVGSWFDSASGTTFLDVVVATKSRDLAVKLGELYNQKAIWDMGQMAEVPTGGSGEKKEFSTPETERLQQAAADLGLGLQFLPKKKKTKVTVKVKSREPKYTPKKLSVKNWLLPDGRWIENLGGFHENWLADNADQLNKKFGTDFKKEADPDERIKALQRGFTRFAYDTNTGTLTVEANTKRFDRQLKDRIFEVVAENLDDIDNVRVSVVNDKGEFVNGGLGRLFNYDGPERLEHIPLITEESQVRRTEFMALPEQKRAPLTTQQMAEMTKDQILEHFPEAVYPKTGGADAKIPYDILGSDRAEKYYGPPPKGKKTPTFDREGAVNDFADELVNRYKKAESMPETALGRDWYESFFPLLRARFGEDAGIFAEILAATSPNTPPATNFLFAERAYKQWKSGAFDQTLAKYEEGLRGLEDGSTQKVYEQDVPEADRPKKVSPATVMAHWIEKHDLLPRQKSGKKFGFHGAALLKVFTRRWLKENAGPKTLNFVQNLTGEGPEATIDVWAIRTMRSLGYEGFRPRWRLLPRNEAAVSDPDFKFSQEVFRRAAEKLGILPRMLQGAMWFAEKVHWFEQGWGRLDLGDYKTEMEKLLERERNPAPEQAELFSEEDIQPRE